MKRGDIVWCVMSSDFGKVRPAVVVQSDLFNGLRETTVLCPLTTTDAAAPLFRIALSPDADNQLEKPSWVMVDKVCAVKNTRIREVQGKVSTENMTQIDAALLLWLGLGN
ncbi:MAG: type II toxin-antitoxin system PemK/MazF family toxin [Thiothrix sp.]